MPVHHPPRPLAKDRRYNMNFIGRFTQREAAKRIEKRPEGLTAEQRAALRKQLEDTQFLTPDYADKTKIDNAGMLRKWRSNTMSSWLTGTAYNRHIPVERTSTNVDTLLVPLTFNIKFDTGIFSWEGHRVQLSGRYLGLACIGARPAEFVDGESKSGKDGCLEELLPRHATRSASSDKDKAPNKHSRVLE
ncbi:hypothetical protein VTI28DRAFT_4526 [Corynascus sepedonium]